jgi:hypothetical protein
MKFTRFIAVVSITFIANGMFAQIEHFVSTEGKFSINFLGGVPTEDAATVPTDGGDVEMISFMYEKGSNEAYMVAITDYSQETMDGSDATTMLQGGKEGALSSLNINGTESETQLTVNGYPGLFFTANNGNFFVCYKLILAENRLYQVAALRAESYLSKKDQATFFDSFNLLISKE